jgi:GNAT superfamily N-acetyltransferase
MLGARIRATSPVSFEMETITRRIVTADLDQLFQLVEQFATSFKPERSAFDVSVRELLLDRAAWLSGAVRGGVLVGYCLGFEHSTLFANGRVSWVEEIMVAESARRTGIGRTLMSEFEEWARGRGSRLVGLATRRAAQFYEALGYEASATYFRRVL